MDTPKRNLPDYDNPPVAEVVLGVQFDPLSNFTALHPGLFWQKVRAGYPNFSAQPPLPAVSEPFGGQPVVQESIAATLFSVPPVPRCWFLDKSENRLIQLQSDRFLHNWKKVTGTEEYPHYDSIFPEFRKWWQKFRTFSAEEHLDRIKPNHWEVTYVNHIFQGQGWNTLRDISNLFPMLSTAVMSGHIADPERLSLNLTYSYPDELARLHVELKTAYRKTDNALLLRLALTARGKLQSEADEALYSCLDFGHKTIVLKFTALTSQEAHALWKRKV